MTAAETGSSPQVVVGRSYVVHHSDGAVQSGEHLRISERKEEERERESSGDREADVTTKTKPGGGNDNGEVTALDVVEN